MKKTLHNLFFLMLILAIQPGCTDSLAGNVPSVDPSSVVTEALERPDAQTFSADVKAQITLFSTAFKDCPNAHEAFDPTPQGVIAYGRACYGPIVDFRKAIAPYETGTFQVDALLAAVARTEDSMRILMWRSQEEQEEKFIKESVTEAKNTIEQSLKRLSELSLIEELNAPFETRLYAEPSETIQRFLNSDKKELGLLYDRVNRGLFNQGVDPNNVRAAAIAHQIHVSKKRSLLRLRHIKNLLAEGKIEKDLAWRWAGYTQLGQTFVGAIQTSLHYQLKGTLKNRTGVDKNKAEVSGHYLNWTKAYEALAGAHL